jgi:uncharacterized membrane protein YdfJ with MMPL/SSD domain
VRLPAGCRAGIAPDRIVVVVTGFATGQLVAFQEMGFGTAVAPALDATLVRLPLEAS